MVRRMGNTIGIHLVWTTYGTWLPGDPDKPGHWSPLFDMYGRLTRAGHQINLPDATTHHHARSLMREPAKHLDPEERTIVADMIGTHIAPALAGVNAMHSLALGSPTSTPAEAGAMCATRAYACAIEPTHVHLLIGAVREDIGRLVGRLKGTTSSALLRHPNNWGRSRIWTAKYWKVFIFDDAALGAVQEYIEHHNIRADEPPSPYAWLTPT